jgi:hypothetical protein
MCGDLCSPLRLGLSGTAIAGYAANTGAGLSAKFVIFVLDVKCWLHELANFSSF